MSGLPPVTQWLHLDWMLVVAMAWLIVGAAGIFALHRFGLVSQVLFPIGGLLGLALFGLALDALLGRPEVAVPAHRAAGTALPSPPGQPVGLSS